MSQSDRDYSEKRDFIRMNIETEVTLSQGTQSFNGTCRDLSSTGMQVTAPTNLQIGDKVTVRIPSEHSELKGLVAETEVVRVSALENGRQNLGLAIVSMN